MIPEFNDARMPAVMKFLKSDVETNFDSKDKDEKIEIAQGAILLLGELVNQENLTASQSKLMSNIESFSKKFKESPDLLNKLRNDLDKLYAKIITDSAKQLKEGKVLSEDSKKIIGNLKTINKETGKLDQELELYKQALNDRTMGESKDNVLDSLRKLTTKAKNKPLSAEEKTQIKKYDQFVKKEGLRDILSEETKKLLDKESQPRAQYGFVPTQKNVQEAKRGMRNTIQEINIEREIEKISGGDPEMKEILKEHAKIMDTKNISKRMETMKAKGKNEYKKWSDNAFKEMNQSIEKTNSLDPWIRGFIMSSERFKIILSNMRVYARTLETEFPKESKKVLDKLHEFEKEIAAYEKEMVEIVDEGKMHKMQEGDEEIDFKSPKK